MPRKFDYLNPELNDFLFKLQQDLEDEISNRMELEKRVKKLEDQIAHMFR